MKLLSSSLCLVICEMSLWQWFPLSQYHIKTLVCMEVVRLCQLQAMQFPILHFIRNIYTGIGIPGEAFRTSACLYFAAD